MQTIYRAATLLAAIFAACSSPLLAQSPVTLSSVTVLPAGTLTPSTLINLDVFLTSGSASINLYSPTQIQTVGNNINVDIFAQSGLLTILDMTHEFVPLGNFSPGTYFYEVRQNGPTLAPPTISGSFQVVPEPATALVAIAPLAACLVRARKRGVSFTRH